MIATTQATVASTQDIAAALGVSLGVARRLLDRAAALGVVRVSFLPGGRRAFDAADLPRLTAWAKGRLSP
jgi:DNA-binding transcriptional regulator LsrR (DeoR family)